MKKWIALAAALLLVLAGLYLGSAPYAARALRKAALAGDVDAISARVDFPAVRENLKPQLRGAATAVMQSDPELRDSPLAGFGALLVPKFVGRIVDAFVTPEAIASLMRGRRPDQRDTAEPHPDIDRNAEFVDLDHFQVRLADTKRNQPGPAFLFERRGFATWKLVKVELPQRWLGDKPQD